MDKKTLKIRIGDRPVGQNEPCFIIAEAGVNHNGDINLAKELIDVAAEAQADAVKFQTFHTENVISPDGVKVRYQKDSTGSGESLFDMIKNLELSDEFTGELFSYAEDKGISFLSSPFDYSSIDLLDTLGVTAFKVASGEITNFPLLRYMARKNKPLILSTGMSTLDEVDAAVRILTEAGNEDIVLLHCVSNYPAKMESSNLRVMDTLREQFGLPVGFSDHSLGITLPIAAVALGACAIEKHFTLDKSLPGPDHKASLEPDELAMMVREIRNVEKALGDGIKRPYEEEEEVRMASRRSIFTAVNIPKGTVIVPELLCMMRPGTGIQPGDLETVTGKKAKRTLPAGTMIKMSDLE